MFFSFLVYSLEPLQILIRLTMTQIETQNSNLLNNQNDSSSYNENINEDNIELSTQISMNSPHHIIDFEKDIEPIKENMQPIRSGRSDLHSLISIKKEERMFQIELFEEEISNNPNNINLYIEYIHFLKKTTGDIASDENYISILKRATENLSLKFKNDIRLLQLWLMYVDLIKDPLEAFRWMEANSVGTMFSDFWIRWTRFIEDQGDFQGAKKILEMGIEREAKPIEKLKKRMQDYFKRIVNRIKNNMTPNEQPSLVTERSTQLNTNQGNSNEIRVPFGVINHTHIFEDSFPLGKRKRDSPLKLQSKKICSDPLNFLIFNDTEDISESENPSIFANTGYVRGKSILAPSTSKRFGTSIFSNSDEPHKRALSDLPFISIEEQSKENYQTVESLLPKDSFHLIALPNKPQVENKIKSKIKPKKKNLSGSKKLSQRLKVYKDKDSSEQGIADSMSRLMI